MNARPHRGAFAAFPKQNDKCPTNAWRGGGGGGVRGGGGEGEVWAFPSHRLEKRYKLL